MTDVFDRMLWTYRSVFTQTNVAGGVIAVRITAKERTQFLYGMFGPDDYAADRTIDGRILDSAGSTIARVLFATAIDNEYTPLWSANAVAQLVDRQTADFSKKVLLGRDQAFHYDLATPVQSETLTMSVQALIESVKPVIIFATSGGTVTNTVTYDKVI